MLRPIFQCQKNENVEDVSNNSIQAYDKWTCYQALKVAFNMLISNF